MSKKLIRGKSFTASKPATVKLAFSKRKREGKLTRQMTEEVKRVTLSLVESKRKHTYSTPGPIDVPDKILLNGIGLGDDNATREGNRIRATSIEVRFSAVAQTSPATVVPTLFCMAVVLDRQPNGATFNTNDLYDDIGGATDLPVALRNDRFLERFKVLWRGDYCLGKFENQGLPMIQDHIYIDLTKQKDEDVTVRYNGSNNTVAGITKNAYYLVMIPSNQALFSPGSNYGQWQYMVKLNFKDA